MVKNKNGHCHHTLMWFQTCMTLRILKYLSASFPSAMDVNAVVSKTVWLPTVFKIVFYRSEKVIQVGTAWGWENDECPFKPHVKIIDYHCHDDRICHLILAKILMLNRFWLILLVNLNRKFIPWIPFVRVDDTFN